MITITVIGGGPCSFKTAYASAAFDGKLILKAEEFFDLLCEDKALLKENFLYHNFEIFWINLIKEAVDLGATDIVLDGATFMPPTSACNYTSIKGVNRLYSILKGLSFRETFPRNFKIDLLWLKPPQVFRQIKNHEREHPYSNEIMQLPLNIEKLNKNINIKTLDKEDIFKFVEVNY